MANFLLQSNCLCFSLLINQKKRAVVAKFLLAVFLVYIAGCNYYKISTQRDQDEIRNEMMTTINANKNFILVQGAEQWGISSLSIQDDKLRMEVGNLAPEIKTINENIEKRKGWRYIDSRRKETGYTERPIIHEIRILVDPSLLITKGSMSIPISSIEQIDIYDKDTGKTSASHFFGVLGVIAGIFVVISIIVLLTKSSCPFIYSFNGENFEFEGESYGGSIFAPLERSDYIPLKHIKPSKGSYLIRISNELKEKQFINFIEMINVLTSPDATALVDKYGTVYSIKAPDPVLMAISPENTPYTDAIMNIDNKKYLFNEGSENTSYLICRFPREQGAGEAKLIINAKGSLWLDYVYGEFTKKMGGFYPEYSRRQNLKSRDELEQWSFDQEIPLKVYLFKNNEWKYIDHFPMAGPLGDPRKMLMKLDLTDLQNETVDIKLETGKMFWEVDYAGLDYSGNEVVEIQYCEPAESKNQDGFNTVKLISSDDRDYLQQFYIGDFANVRFPASKNDPALNLTNILHIKGYYEHIRDYEGIPDFVSLFEFKKPGVFTAFSNKMYCEKAGIIYPDLISKKTN